MRVKARLQKPADPAGVSCENLWMSATCTHMVSVPCTQDDAPNAPSAVLDLRRLPAPQPMACALDAVDALAPGATLTLLTPLMPMPLLQMLDTRGFACSAQLLRDGCARVQVTRPLT